MSNLVLPLKNHIQPTGDAYISSRFADQIRSAAIPVGNDLRRIKGAAFTASGTLSAGCAHSTRYVNTTSGYFYRANTIPITERDYVICLEFTPDDLVNTGSIFSFGSNPTDGSPALILQKYYGGLRVYIGGGYYIITGDIFSLGKQTTAVLKLTKFSGGTHSLKMWVGGIDYVWEVTGASAVGNATNEYVGSGYPNSFIGGIGLYFTGINLSDTECRELANNPWQIFAQQKRVVYFDTGTGESLLAGDPATQFNVAGSGVISQVQSLAGNSAAQVSSSTSGVITAAQLLVGSSVSQANAATTSSLAQSQLLTGNVDSQDNTTATSFLYQAQLLAGNNAAQTSTSTAGELAAEGSLISSNVTQGNTSTAGIVSQAQVLAGSSTIQGNTSNAGALSQVQLLAGNTASQANASTTVAVVQAQTLVGSSASQSNITATGELILDGSVLLAGNATSQANLSSTGAISQVQVLAGSNSSSLSNSTTGQVNQGITLSGNSCAQSNSVSTGQLVQIQALVGGHAAQANSSTTGEVFSGYLLTGASSTQTNECDAGHITQAFTLAANPCIQANTSSTGRLVDRVNAESIAWVRYGYKPTKVIIEHSTIRG